MRSVLLIMALMLVACGGEEGDSLPWLPGRLAYVDHRNGRDHLYVADRSDGRNAREVTIRSVTVLPAHDAGTSNLDPGQIRSMEVPVWSPGGDRIAMVVGRTEGQSQILVIDPSTGNAVTASYQLGETDSPDWSPDGTRLIYVLADSGHINQRLASTHFPGGELHEFMGTLGMDFVAWRWTDDASRIRFAFREAGLGDDNFRVIDVTTEIVESVDQRPYGVAQPLDIWRDGQVLIQGIDPEFRNLGVIRPYDEDPGRSVLFNQGPILGWFLSSPELVAIESFSWGGERAEPAIGKYNPALLMNGNRFDLYSVRAPVPFKWDFQLDDSGG